MNIKQTSNPSEIIQPLERQAYIQPKLEQYLHWAFLTTGISAPLGFSDLESGEL
jgi:hypothetical protein